MTAIKQERATVRWKTNRTVSVPGRPANADTYNCESFDATVVFMDEKLPDTDRRRAVVQTERLPRTILT